MIYADQTDLSLIVAAADDLIAFEAFYQQAAAAPGLYVSLEQPDLIDMMTKPEFQGFEIDPHVATFADAAALESFRERFGITVLSHNKLLAMHREMLKPTKKDEWLGPASDEPEDRRTIAESFGLDASDPWDKRTDEQKAADAEEKKAYDEALSKAKAGQLSGDSFGAGSREGGLVVTDIRGREDGDQVIVDEITAQKTGGASAEPKEPLVLTGEHAKVTVFFKVDIKGATLTQIRDLDRDAEGNYALADHAVDAQERPDGSCWVAFLRLSLAEEAAAIIRAAGYEVEVYAVNAEGQRLVPKSVTVVDTGAAAGIPHPRPWNARAAEIDAMTPEEREANLKTMTGAEFIIAGSYRGGDVGTIVHITPASYFEEHEEVWPEPLNIAHLLPPDFKELRPGVYQARTLDYIGVNFQLCNKRGFGESLLLKVFLNSL